MNIVNNTIKTVAIALVFLAQTAYADKNVGKNDALNKNGGPPKFLSACSQGKANTDLDINNVRARILSGGDMWWDLTNNAKYEVPKVTPPAPSINSLFAGALWIGGKDNAGNLKMAAQTYRQTGNDMWPGAIDKVSIAIDPARCKHYDRHWKITKQEVFDFVNGIAPATKDIKEWPGNGDPAFNEDYYLAPYNWKDTNRVGQPYDATQGDYPYYNFSGVYPNNICNDYVFGDQTLWWVINDVGDVHGETGGDPIGLEIRCQAFGFKTNDEINNMTFYKYQIINRSSQTLSDTYFGVWIDPDLGNATDDYEGCDVRLGLGFAYNADADDEGAGGYGLNPPSIGIDFFQGPLADPGDGIDNNMNGVIDEPGEQIIMSSFLFYLNVNGVFNGNPSGAVNFYRYLQGIWGDGQHITYGADGHTGASPCNYMFPGLSDPNFPTTEWTMASPPVQAPADGRMVESAGKFTLLPGAVNYITTGAVWARTSSGGPLASVQLMKLADAKAQAVFDHCFQVLDGPNAPDMAIRELKNELILSLENYNDSTVELYQQVDPTLPAIIDTTAYSDEQRSYKFQGYILYQLKDATVTTNDVGNPDKIRQIAQCDIKDTVSKLVNNSFDGTLNYWVPELKVDGANAGIHHIFDITKDAFALGDPKLINNRQYYFTVVAYAYNNFAPFMPSISASNGTQAKPFFQGRKNIKTYTGIPHIPQLENNGQVFSAKLGDRPVFQRMEGQGNNGLVLDMMQYSSDEALNAPAYRSYNPVYEKNKGPLNIYAYDPVLITASNYQVRFNGVTDSSGWEMTNFGNGQVTSSEQPLGTFSEQILGYKSGKTFVPYGLSASIMNPVEPGVTGAVNNGFLEASITYSDDTKKWLSFIADANGSTYEDWIKPESYAGIDDSKVYETVLGGTWAPFKLLSKDQNSWSPKWNNALLDGTSSGLLLSKIASVDIVFTSDQSKWTRAAVLEIDNNTATTVPPGVKKFDMRKSPSVDKSGKANYPSADNNDFPTGMSWFPGYAVNVETGERLNIAFGENSSLNADMIWNPSSVRYDAAKEPVFGGMHYIYVFGHNNDSPVDVPRYDGCRFIVNKLNTASIIDKRNVYKDCMWVSCPMLKAGQSLNATDCKVRLRVAKTFRQYDTRRDIFAGSNMQSNTLYKVLKDTIYYNSLTKAVGDTFTTDASNLTITGNGSVVGGASLNNSNPLYKFSTDSLANSTNNTEAAVDALRFINIVPNPYYAFSGYEASQIDNRVRITNLPPRCTISIFTLSGTLIKRYNRAAATDNSLGGTLETGNTSTSVDWDMKNTKGVPIASGLYLIHVDAPGLGERILKFFAVMRPVDLDTY